MPEIRKETLYVEFHPYPVVDPEESRVRGYEVSRDVDYVRVRTDQYSQLDRAATEADKARWPRQWAAYQAKKSQKEIGIPFSQWSYMTPAKIRNYENQDVYTVEQLAGLSDSRCQALGMGAMEDRKRAVAYIESLKSGEAIDALALRVKELEANEKTLKEALAARDSAPQKGSKKAEARI